MIKRCVIACVEEPVPQVNLCLRFAPVSYATQRAAIWTLTASSIKDMNMAFRSERIAIRLAINETSDARKQKPSHRLGSLIWCPNSESNQGHGDFNPLLYRLSYSGNGAH